jgi:uncharacterized cupredoxin-like copper-binding protein
MHERCYTQGMLSVPLWIDANLAGPCALSQNERVAIGRHSSETERSPLLKNRHVLGLCAALSVLLVVLVACGSSTTTTPSGSQEVQVTLTGTTMTSSMTTFSPGMSYHFVVTNHGQDAQEFAMMPMGMDMEHMSMNALRSNALHMIDSIAPGTTASFDYTFASSMMGRNFEFSCLSSGHNTGWMSLPFMISQ